MASCLINQSLPEIFLMSKIEKGRNLLILIVISAILPALADDDAERYFDAGDWAAAADAFTVRTQDDPEDVSAWYRLAVSARQAKRYAVARDALDQAEKRQYSPVRIKLERARLGAQTGDSAGAVAELRAIAESGFSGVNAVTGDSVLAQLAGREDYDSLIAAMSRRAFPCEHDAAFSEFDFWIGEWDVHAANGTYAGSNSIGSEQRGCLLTESWRSATGNTGTSINYLDKTSGEWVQIWNDSGGNQINIRGGMTDDGMLLTGSIHYVTNGTTAGFRGLWTPLEDGRVRQFFEQQSDDGATWSTWFEGFYTRNPLAQTDSRKPN